MLVYKDLQVSVSSIQRENLPRGFNKTLFFFIMTVYDVPIP